MKFHRTNITSSYQISAVNCEISNTENKLSTSKKTYSVLIYVDFRTNLWLNLFVYICVSDDSVEAPPGSLSSKAPLPAPRLKRAPSEQDRESTCSSPAGPLSPLDGYYLYLTINNRTNSRSDSLILEVTN